jgi:hypothetical protein
MVSTNVQRVNEIVFMMKHDPAVVAGFVLIGASATFLFHIHRKLLSVGEDTSALFFRIPNTAIWTVPLAYLKACSKNGWSGWQAYAAWVTAVSGLLFLVDGLFRLTD